MHPLKINRGQLGEPVLGLRVAWLGERFRLRFGLVTGVVAGAHGPILCVRDEDDQTVHVDPRATPVEVVEERSHEGTSQSR